MKLAEISKAHRNALQVVEDGIAVYSVKEKAIEAFDAARRDFQNVVDKLQVAEPLKTFGSLCSQIHAHICRTPCSPAWLVESFKPRIQDLQSGLKPTLHSADETIRTSFKTVCGRLADVQNIRVNPLATDARAMLDLSGEASEQVIVVIRQTALWPSVRAALDPDSQRQGFRIMKPSELRRASSADRLILFGPPWLFEYREEQFLFRSPAAGKVDLFVFAHDCGGQISASALESQYVTFKGIETRPSTAENLLSEPLFMFKPRTMAPRAPLGMPFGEKQDHIVQVAVWPVYLGGNRGTYLDPEGTVFTVECAPNGEDAICTGVERRDAEELEIGDLVVLTTEGGGDLIRPLADEILGELAQIYHQRQDEWKRKLRERVNIDGVTSVVATLRQLGSRLAKESNVRTWISDRNIGPSDLTNDFGAILVLTGLAGSAASYISAISNTRGAHQAAGRKLQNRLLVELKGKDMRKAFVDGFIEVRTEEGGPAKTIFLVEHITRESTPVPSHSVARVFHLEEPNG